ncbi:MAG: RNA polymerase sigma factor [Bacteroidota bacterium]
MDEDRAAVHRLKTGDIGGLETLVCRYQLKAIRAAFLILHDEPAAEDVAQETFLRVFKHIQRFDENRPFGPYLLRSVVNAALDAAQKASRGRQVAASLESVEGLIQRAMSVESQADFNALKGALSNALEQLPPRQRAAVVMRYYLQMSESEMASALNSRPGTVKWLLNAARARLRTLLDAEWRSE